jgi:hypothetical protein
VYTYYLAILYSTILLTFANPSRAWDKQQNALSLPSLNSSCGLSRVHKRRCGMLQVVTVVLVSSLRNITPCIYVSRHQFLLGLAALKVVVRSPSEETVPVYLSTLHCISGDGNFRSSCNHWPCCTARTSCSLVYISLVHRIFWFDCLLEDTCV